MLQPISLDNQGFEEIFRKARSQIAEIYPIWNDYNYHDPGITLLELFAFLKEAQQFHMDYSNPAVLKGFLALLDGVQQDAVPACVCADFTVDQAMKIGSKYWVNDICFEATRAMSVTGDCIDGVLTKDGYHQAQDHYRDCLLFGDTPYTGDSCYFCLTRSLAPHQTHQLTLTFAQKQQRNPIKNVANFIKLADISLSCWTDQGFVPLAMEDTTVGFLQDGTLTFHLPYQMVARQLRGMTGYFLKLTLQQDQYDFPPMLLSARFCSHRLEQHDTQAQLVPITDLSDYALDDKIIDYYRAEEDRYYKSDADHGTVAVLYQSTFYDHQLIGVGSGMPSQQYQLGRKQLLRADRVDLLVESVLEKGCYHRFTRVANFASSTPSSRHFMVDEQGLLQFGNDIHGFCPETVIILVGLAFTNMQQGDVARHTVVQTAEKQSVGQVAHTVTSAKPAESIEDLTTRLQQYKNGRMVTAYDYEQAILHTEGLCISDCKVLPSEDDEQSVVRVVVRTNDDRHTLSKLYKQNILRQIEPKRLLGTTVQLQSPTYTHVEVYVELLANKRYLYAQQEVHNTVNLYIQSLDRFHPVIEHNALYRLINSLPAVHSIHALTIDAKGDGVLQSRNGDIITPPAGVILLDQIHCTIVN